MTKFVIEFYRSTTTTDTHEIEVEADNEMEAREKIRACFEDGEDTLTQEELATEEMVREGEISGSEFDGFPDYA